MTVYSNSISGQLEPGEAERWVVETRSYDAVRATISADGQPYEVDIQTGSELNFPTYESVLPLGPEKFADTEEHTIGTDTTEDAVFVQVTNTANETVTVSGSISRHSEDAETTVSSFLTAGTGNRPLAYRDGELLTDTDKASIRSIVGGLVSSELTSLEDGNLVVDSGALTADVTTDPDRDDDQRLHFGADDNYFIEYDATSSGWVFGSTDIDGSGTEGVLFRVDDASRITDFLGAIDMGGNIIQNLGEPNNPGEAARKGYVDGVAQGLNLKEEVSAATNGTSIDLTSSTDPNPIDGYTLSDGDRVLLKDQSTGSENGVYVAQTAADPSTWARAPDLDEDEEVVTGVFCFVANGTENNNKSFVITTNNPITLGTDTISWSVFTTAGQLTAGSGLTKSGQTFSISLSFQYDWYDKSAGGKVNQGDAGLVFNTSLADGETFEVTQASLTAGDSTAVASGVDLIIADITNGTSEATIISGDGSTVYADETNNPLASHTNTTGSEVTVAVLIDNGQFNAGNGNDQSAFASFIGKTVE